ncbi:MAG TPA: prolipoprotein diacylglyceryl transferase [Actinomycetota bacterium]|nr:prolipoprotein diacylglyceryl transferase [Actinomycetota bacterium]
MLASIPYRTFPTIDLGPVHLHTFGVFVALGFLVGTWLAARAADARGIDRDEIYRLGGWIVLAGIVGSRIAWVLAHPSEIHSVMDVVAVWQGGLTFTGGFILAVAVAIPWVRRWSPRLRWAAADAIALGLSAGIMLGRIGCYSVGEHLGHPTSFFLGVRYLGGVTREGPLVVGVTYHNTALYEFLHLVALTAILSWMLRHRPPFPPGAAIGLFCLWYGIARFGTDFLRAYDDRVLGLTAAQWLCLVLIPTGIWILATGPRRARRLEVPEAERSQPITSV